MQQIMKFMPLMFGYFALVVPAGLTLYWFTSNILALVQQYFTKTQLQADSPKDKKKPIISTSMTENTPLPASSTPSDGATAISGEDGKSTNVKSKRKRRKR
jgi:YidC/Oxa1 family membrane protein insertase